MTTDIKEGIPVAILFDEMLEHAKAVEGYSGVVVSAGFCHFESSEIDDVCAYGKSISLQKRSGPQDAEIIKDSMRRSLDAMLK